MNFLRKLFGTEKRGLSSTSRTASPGDFIKDALQKRSARCQIRIVQFQKVYDSLSEGFKRQGVSGAQLTDILWASLSATCPKCGWRISGDDLGSLWMMGAMGFDQAVALGSGTAVRFGKGMCPNQACSCEDIVLMWEAYPADDLSPFTPTDGDEAALKTYWRNSAGEWWKNQTRGEAICDKCMATIPHGEGYYSPAVYADLVCEQCCESRLSPDRLTTLYREKGSGPRQELRAARQLAGIVSRSGRSPSSDLMGKATTIIVDYEGSENREVEKKVIEEVYPLLKLGRCRVITHCAAHLPIPEPGEPTCSLLLFDINTGNPRNVSLYALMSYIAADQEKGLHYSHEKIGYWIGRVHGRSVLVVLCME